MRVTLTHLRFQLGQTAGRAPLTGRPRMLMAGAPEPPAALLQRAKAAFRQQQRRLPQRRHITAIAQPLAPATPGRRGVQQEEQFLYATDAYDIDIQCTYDTTTQSAILQGQILARSPDAGNLEGVEVRLIAVRTEHGPMPARLRLTDALGQFTFSYLVVGEYQIMLLFAEEEVSLDGIVIKNKPSTQL